MRKDTFIFYLEWLRTMDAASLSKAERSRLIDAIVSYADTGKVQDLPRLLTAIFQPIKNTIDKDTEKYAKIIEKNRANGALGGRPKNPEKPKITQNNPTVIAGKPKKTDRSHYDNDNVNDYVLDNVADTTAPNEEEKGELLEIFFWRNLTDPAAELNRFIDYNAKRKWKALDTPTKRITAAAEWQPQDSKPRVRQEFLDMWYRLYRRIRAEVNDMLAAYMIDSAARIECQGGVAKLRLSNKLLRDYIEEQRPPEILEYIGNLRLTTAAP